MRKSKRWAWHWGPGSNTAIFISPNGDYTSRYGYEYYDAQSLVDYLNDRG